MNLKVQGGKFAFYPLVGPMQTEKLKKKSLNDHKLKVNTVYITLKVTACRA